MKPTQATVILGFVRAGINTTKDISCKSGIAREIVQVRLAELTQSGDVVSEPLPGRGSGQAKRYFAYEMKSVAR